MKKIIKLTGTIVFLLALSLPVYSQSITMDEAITRAAAFFLQRLPLDTNVAVAVESPSAQQSSYVQEEMINRLDASGKFTIFDSIFAFWADYSINILIKPQGGGYLMTVNATDARNIPFIKRAYIIKPEISVIPEEKTPSVDDNQWKLTITPNIEDAVYYDGDYMFMYLNSNRDCYFRITHIDVDGKTQLIYPLSLMDNSFIRAGDTRRIPDNNMYRMGPPFGEESILVEAFETPFSGFQAVITDPIGTASFKYKILPKN